MTDNCDTAILLQTIPSGAHDRVITEAGNCVRQYQQLGSILTVRQLQVQSCKDHSRSQWSSSNMPDCRVTGPRFESHRGQLQVFTVRCTQCERGIAIVRCHPSVTLWYHGHIGWTTSKVITLILVIGVAPLSRKPAISLKRGKIWLRLRLMTNRKSHICAFDWCQNQRPSMTLKGHYALCFKTHASFGAHHKNLNVNRPIPSATKCSLMTLVSGNVRLMWIFAGVLWRRGIKRLRGNQKRQFSGLSDAISSAP